MTFDDVLPLILTQAEGCAEQLAVLNARLAAIEFCQEAAVWQGQQTAISSVADTTGYAYAAQAGAQVVKLLGLQLNGIDVNVIDPGKGWSYVRRGVQSAFAYGGPGRFELRPVTAAGLPIVTFCQLAPSNDATELPDVLSRYAEAIARGALSRILRVPGKGYTDMNLAAVSRAEFNSDIGSARTAVLRGFAQAAVRTAPFNF